MNRTICSLAATALAMAACGGVPPVPQPVPTKAPVAKPEVPAVASSSPPPVEQAPAVPAMTVFGNGMTVVHSTVPWDGEAQLQLCILGGTDFAAPGVAELAAEAVVAGTDASTGRPNLRQAIAKIGGTLKVEVGTTATWITVRVPAARWGAANTAMAAAVSAPTQSRSQLERIRDEFVAQRIGAIWSNPAREATRVFLFGDCGTDDYMSALLDRDVSEIALFQTRLYRPDAALLSLRVPGNQAKVFETLAAGLGSWHCTGARPAVPVTERRLKPGIYWAPSAPIPMSKVTVVLPLPDQLRHDAADLFLLHNCITLDGIGGRLESLQRERGLGQVRWRVEFLQFAETAALALSTEVPADSVVPLWQCVEGARRSLLELPPTDSEYELARRRAMLTARLGENDTASELRNLTVLVMRRISPQALQKRFEELADRRLFDATTIAKRYLEMPAAMIVLGGAVPQNATGITNFDLLPAGALTRLAGGNTQIQVAAAVPMLDEAMEAVGGASTLKMFSGCEAAAKLQASRSPAVDETVSWSTSGALLRKRTVLDNVIETRVLGDKGTEKAVDKQIELKAGEVAALQREALRHPIALLAAHARGELQFRPIAQRNIGDRDLMILEAIGDRFDRLRIYIDTISHLVRVVEIWETTVDGAVVHLQDAWSDYRSSGGLRVPFRRITTQDDGQNRIETIWSRWAPQFAVK